MIISKEFPKIMYEFHTHEALLLEGQSGGIHMVSRSPISMNTFMSHSLRNQKSGMDRISLWSLRKSASLPREGMGIEGKDVIGLYLGKGNLIELVACMYDCWR